MKNCTKDIGIYKIQTLLTIYTGPF